MIENWREMSDEELAIKIASIGLETGLKYGILSKINEDGEEKYFLHPAFKDVFDKHLKSYRLRRYVINRDTLIEILIKSVLDFTTFMAEDELIPLVMVLETLVGDEAYDL